MKLMNLPIRMLAFVTALALSGLLLLAGPALASAQGAGTPAAGANRGLQQAVNRNYATNALAPFVATALSGTPVATPSAMAASPVSSAGLQTASGFIFAYGTADQAKAAFASESASIFKAFNDRFSAQTHISLAPATAAGVGSAANAWSGSGPVRGATLNVFAIVAQQDNDLYFTALVAKDSGVKDATVSFTKALIGAKAGAGAGTLQKDGVSTGGLWDKFPKAGDPVLQGLKPVNDMQVYP